MTAKYFIVFIISLNIFSSEVLGKNNTRPHIVIIVADDLGWNDVGFHGSNQIPTPNIDALAYNGVILNNHYTGAVCTPSRAALMTGKYPISLGMQHLALEATEPRGLPLSEKLLPQYLKDGGYATHIVGKWHLGFFKKEYTPTFRGFDSHFGYWSGHQDYYNHEFESSDEYRGYDMRRNMSVSLEDKNRYSTDLYTEETVRLIDTHDKDTPMFVYLAHAAVHSGNAENLLQAPDEEVAKFSYISDPERRKYAAMVSKLDKSVGDVVAALRRNKMLENSIILFVADNGAPTFGAHHNAGSNYPLRGMKTTAWEGAVRCVAAVWSPLIKQSQRVSNQLFHMSDWLPTLLSAAEINATLSTLDGFNMWPTIVDDDKAPRTEVLINIDEISNYSAIRHGDYKYLVGYPGAVTGWYGNLTESEDSPLNYDLEDILRSKAGAAITGMSTDMLLADSDSNAKILTSRQVDSLRAQATLHCDTPRREKVACDPMAAPCLFNLKEDPCEMTNIIDLKPEIGWILEEFLTKYRNASLPAANIPGDVNGDPVKWHGLWVNWQDPDPEVKAFIPPKAETDCRSSNPVLVVVLGCLLIVAVAIIIILMIKTRRKSSMNRNYRVDMANGEEFKSARL